MRTEIGKALHYFYLVLLKTVVLLHKKAKMRTYLYNKGGFFFRLEQSLDLGGFSSDDDSLNYEDNADLESTIDKLRQLLLDKSGETESMSSEEAVQSPTSIKSSFYHNFRVTKKSLEESPSSKSDFSPNLEESHQEVLVISFDTNDSEKNVRLIG